MSPAGTLCFDIFSPPPGDSDVISQVERLSSNEMNIAPRSLRIAFGASSRSATVCMVVSRVGCSQPHSARAPVAIHLPWDLDRLWRRQRAQKIAEIVGERMKLETNRVGGERPA